MNEQHAKLLMSEFPRLFRKSKANPSPFDYRGFESGDGWYQLIHQLCIDIEKAAAEAGLKPNSRAWPRVLQVKEKFGGLRFYIKAPQLKLRTEHAPFLEFTPQASIESIRDLIFAAELKSMTICEQCGAPGTLCRDGWIVTLCELCKAGCDKELRQ